jgi:hypothetical protein
MHWSTLINSHVTLVFIWLEHESWGNFHANSHFSAALINAHPRLTGASIYTLLWEYYCLWSPFRRGWVRCVTFNLCRIGFCFVRETPPGNLNYHNIGLAQTVASVENFNLVSGNNRKYMWSSSSLDRKMNHPCATSMHHAELIRINLQLKLYAVLQLCLKLQT